MKIIVFSNSESILAINSNGELKPDRVFSILNLADKIIAENKSTALFLQGLLVQGGRIVTSREFVEVATTDLQITRNQFQKSYKFNFDIDLSTIDFSDESIYGLPTFLNYAEKGSFQELVVGKNYVSSFVVPIDNLSFLELPFKTISKMDIGEQKLRFVMRTESGKKIAEKCFNLKGLGRSGNLRLTIPVLSSLKGGLRCFVSLSVLENGAENQGEIAGNQGLKNKTNLAIPFAEISYPFLSDLQEGPAREIVVFNFVPGLPPLWLRGVPLIKRAVRMLLSGDIERFKNALNRRLPVLVGKIKSRLLPNL